MNKDFPPEDRKREAKYFPRPTYPRSDSGEELQIFMDMGSSEDYTLTALRISYGTTRGMI